MNSIPTNQQMSTESPLVIHTGSLLSNLDQETQARVLELRYMKSPLVEAKTPFARKIQNAMKEASYYDIKTGMFIRTKITGRRAKLGQMARINNCSHMVIGISNYSFLQSHLTYLWFTGLFPKTGEILDHIDGNTYNEYAGNLRIVSPALSSRNCKKYSSNSSGYVGVSLLKTVIKKSYRAYINVDKKQINLGCFSTAEEAATARNNWLQNHPEYGFTARHGT